MLIVFIIVKKYIAWTLDLHWIGDIEVVTYLKVLVSVGAKFCGRVHRNCDGWRTKGHLEDFYIYLTIDIQEYYSYTNNANNLLNII